MLTVEPSFILKGQSSLQAFSISAHEGRIVFVVSSFSVVTPAHSFWSVRMQASKTLFISIGLSVLNGLHEILVLAI